MLITSKFHSKVEVPQVVSIELIQIDNVTDQTATKHKSDPFNQAQTNLFARNLPSHSPIKGFRRYSSNKKTNTPETNSLSPDTSNNISSSRQPLLTTATKVQITNETPPLSSTLTQQYQKRITPFAAKAQEFEQRSKKNADNDIIRKRVHTKNSNDDASYNISEKNINNNKSTHTAADRKISSIALRAKEFERKSKKDDLEDNVKTLIKHAVTPERINHNRNITVDKNKSLLQDNQVNNNPNVGLQKKLENKPTNTNSEVNNNIINSSLIDVTEQKLKSETTTKDGSSINDQGMEPSLQNELESNDQPKISTKLQPLDSFTHSQPKSSTESGTAIDNEGKSVSDLMNDGKTTPIIEESSLPTANTIINNQVLDKLHTNIIDKSNDTVISGSNSKIIPTMQSTISNSDTDTSSVSSESAEHLIQDNDSDASLELKTTTQKKMLLNSNVIHSDNVIEHHTSKLNSQSDYELKAEVDPQTKNEDFTSEVKEELSTPLPTNQNTKMSEVDHEQTTKLLLPEKQTQTVDQSTTNQHEELNTKSIGAQSTSTLTNPSTKEVQVEQTQITDKYLTENIEGTNAKLKEEPSISQISNPSVQQQDIYSGVSSENTGKEHTASEDNSISSVDKSQSTIASYTEDDMVPSEHKSTKDRSDEKNESYSTITSRLISKTSEQQDETRNTQQKPNNSVTGVINNNVKSVHSNNQNKVKQKPLPSPPPSSGDDDLPYSNSGPFHKFNVSSDNSISYADTIRTQIQAHWNHTIGAVPDISVILILTLNLDGSVQNIEVKGINCPTSDSIYCKAFLQNIKRAIWAASPFQNLPAEKYKLWQQLTFEFIPENH